MNLTSCGECGVVLDKDVLDFAPEGRKYTDQGSIDSNRFTWWSDKDDYVAFVDCSVCEAQVLNI